MNNAQGADVSLWEVGTIDFSKYAAQFDFVGIKVSEGTRKDPLFAQQWAAAKGRTVRYPYHFWRSYVDQKLAVQNMLSLLGTDAGEIEVALDLEAADGSTSVMSTAKVWVDEYHRLTNRWPMIYSTISFLQENGAFAKTIYGAYKNPWLANCKFWLAQYPFDEIDSMPGYTQHGDALRAVLIQEIIDGKRLLPWPKPPALFNRVDLWQWTSRYPPERVPGYYFGPNHPLAVDMNFYADTREQFRLTYPIGGITPPAPGGNMQYKVVWSNGASVRPQPSTAGNTLRILAFGAIVDVVQDKIADRTDPTNVNKRWVKLPDGTYAASNYPDGTGPQQRMALVTVTPPPPPSTDVFKVTIALDNNGVVLKPKSIDSNGDVVLG